MSTDRYENRDIGTPDGPGPRRALARTPRGLGRRALALLVAGLMLAPGPIWAQNPAAPPSLKTIPVPEPSNLGMYLKSDPRTLNADGYPVPTAAARAAAIALGKALFWDMQVGSDNVTACATCHFHAGADSRTKNQVSPGLKGGDVTFQVAKPNASLTPTMFPLTKFQSTDDRFSAMLADRNDVISSQGVHRRDYGTVLLNPPREQNTIVADPVFNVGGVNVRRVEPRNAPTVVNAAFNFANFWDGRANNVFNGVNPFGDADPDAGVYVNVNGALMKQRVRLPMSSLASQAVGPPGSDFEMSAAGRGFPHIGRKLISAVPLARQKVHPRDSVLGPMANSTIVGGVVFLRPGLNTRYDTLVRNAFRFEYWNSSQIVRLDNGTATVTARPVGRALAANEFTQMEINFSLFFGLALQMYEATLVSNDSPFDRFQEGDVTAMSQSAQAGLNIFLSDAAELASLGGSCINCHGGSEFTNASASHVGATNFGASLPEALLELMNMGDGGSAVYDAGYYDIGVRPMEEDPGRGASDPFGYPLSFTDRSILMNGGTALPFANPTLPCGQPGFPPVCPQTVRSATPGSFKAPTLRNVELTGPYFHNGGKSTLMQVVDFYTRGGDFHERNLFTLAPDIEFIFGLAGNEAAKRALVDFLMALTDERVRWEQAPFDHPELLVPNGSPGTTTSVSKCNGVSCDALARIPAVGALGLSAEGLPPIRTFLNLDPHVR